MTATSTNPTAAALRAEAMQAATQAGTASEFNALLMKMHGSTTCLTSTMNTLAPFPAIAALPDATVLDLHISLSRHAGGSIDVAAKVRYGTAVTAGEAAGFYHQLLTSRSNDVTSIIGAPGGADAHFDAALTDGRYCARVFDLGHTTTAIVQAESTHTLEDTAFGDLANWHGFGPVDGACVDNVEVFTVAAGASAPVQAVYSTEYDFPGVGIGQLRSLTDALLREHGLSTCETFENILLFDGPFGGEAHIAGTDDAARLILVGEFALSDDAATFAG